MKGTSNQFLTSSRFAPNEHRGIGFCDFRNQAKNVSHLMILSHNLVETVAGADFPAQAQNFVA